MSIEPQESKAPSGSSRSAWDAIGDQMFGSVKQRILSRYEGIAALLREMPESQDPSYRQAAATLQEAITNDAGTGLRAEVAGPLNEALKDPKLRAEVVQMAKNDPEALKRLAQRIKEHPEQTAAIIASAQSAGARKDAPQVAEAGEASEGAGIPPSSVPPARGSAEPVGIPPSSAPTARASTEQASVFEKILQMVAVVAVMFENLFVRPEKQQDEVVASAPAGDVRPTGIVKEGAREVSAGSLPEEIQKRIRMVSTDMGGAVLAVSEEAAPQVVQGGRASNGTLQLLQ